MEKIDVKKALEILSLWLHLNSPRNTPGEALTVFEQYGECFITLAEREEGEVTIGLSRTRETTVTWSSSRRDPLAARAALAVYEEAVDFACRWECKRKEVLKWTE